MKIATYLKDSGKLLYLPLKPLRGGAISSLTLGKDTS